MEHLLVWKYLFFGNPFCVKIFAPEFRKADLAVAVLVDCLDHFINLFVGHLNKYQSMQIYVLLVKPFQLICCWIVDWTVYTNHSTRPLSKIGMRDILQSNLAGQMLEHKLHLIGGNTAFVVFAEHPKSVLKHVHALLTWQGKCKKKIVSPSVKYTACQTGWTVKASLIFASLSSLSLVWKIIFDKKNLEMCLGVHLPRLFLDDEAEVLEKKHKL